MVNEAFKRGLLAAALTATGVSVAFADEAAAPAKWADTLKFSGHVDGGVMFSGNNPADNVNFGHLYTDRANEAVLNQLMVTLTRPIDSTSSKWDFGFTLQALYGADARYNHVVNEFDYATDPTEINQITLFEADLQVHAPILFSGGVDFKLGQIPTLLGYEVTDSTGNFFYSHSYMFNFGVPVLHTGLEAIAHINPNLDVYLQADTGTNTGIPRVGDNNDAAGFLAGIGFRALGGNLSVVASTHIGPENPRSFAGPTLHPNSTLRYYNDLNAAYKVNDKLTVVGDFNYVEEDGFHDAKAYGAALYGLYAVNDWLSVGLRYEIYRDESGFFVGEFPGFSDIVDGTRGYPADHPTTGFDAFGGETTYSAITAGVNIKVPLPKVTTVQGLMIRPEVRYDSALTNTKPFNQGISSGFVFGTPKSDQLTYGFDAILSF
jgi:hypothetical protein